MKENSLLKAAIGLLSHFKTASEHHKNMAEEHTAVAKTHRAMAADSKAVLTSKALQATPADEAVKAEYAKLIAQHEAVAVSHEKMATAATAQSAACTKMETELGDTQKSLETNPVLDSTTVSEAVTKGVEAAMAKALTPEALAAPIEAAVTKAVEPKLNKSLDAFDKSMQERGGKAFLVPRPGEEAVKKAASFVSDGSLNDTGI